MMVFSPALVLLLFAAIWGAGLHGRVIVAVGAVALSAACAAHTWAMLRRTDRSVRHRAGRERRR
jgi:hypothetical protein